MDPWLEAHLVCPRDHHKLQLRDNILACPQGHTYPYVDGIPVMLLDDVEPTHQASIRSIEQARVGVPWLGPISQTADVAGCVDPFVQKEIGATNGVMYRPLIDRLSRYPVPDLPLPQGSGQRLLDIGCNWGRWCVAAAQDGYSAVGIDPSLEAIMAARRVAMQLSLDTFYVVADARYLPFANSSFDVVFSYSVLQHFDKRDVKLTLEQVRRVLHPSGVSLIQMANCFGMRNLWTQVARRFRQPRDFEVRYWRPRELQNTFSMIIGPTTLQSDGYFSLNPQSRDLDLLPMKFKAVIACSDVLRKMSGRLRWMATVADSLYVRSIGGDGSLRNAVRP